MSKLIAIFGAGGFAREVLAIIRKATSMEPERRYRDAGEFAEALEALVAGVSA